MLADAAPAVRSLTTLQGLTYLALGGDLTDKLLAAVGQLTGLVSLELWDISDGAPLQPLAALQRLTSLDLTGMDLDVRIDEQQARVLASLAQLRRLLADFDSPAAAAAAGLARLEKCEVAFVGGPQGGALGQAPGHLRTCTAFMACFDLSSVHTLEQRRKKDQEEGGALCQQLSRCQQLHAVDLCWFAEQPEALLQAIAALPQLQHLCLHAWSYNPHLHCSCLAALAGGSRQLRQLTLWGFDLSESTLEALMVGLPQLRMLRMLGCSAALSQERCQALVGRLQLYELQVDVVVDDGSLRARWMMGRLGERWMEA
jgi:hypothetical protein